MVIQIQIDVIVYIFWGLIGAQYTIYLLRGEIADAMASKNENRVNLITYPRYIIYDFETDTSTDIHKPNHVEVDV